MGVSARQVLVLEILLCHDGWDTGAALGTDGEIGRRSAHGLLACRRVLPQLFYP